MNSKYIELKSVATQSSFEDLCDELNGLKTLDVDERKCVLTRVLVDVILVAENPSATNVKCLLEHSADANGLDEDRGGPLKYAYLIGLDMIIELLLEHSADPNLGNGVLEDAVKRCDGKYVARFLKAGAKPRMDMVDSLVEDSAASGLAESLMNKRIQKTLLLAISGAEKSTDNIELPERLKSSDIKVLTFDEFAPYPDTKTLRSSIASHPNPLIATTNGVDASTAGIDGKTVVMTTIGGTIVMDQRYQSNNDTDSETQCEWGEDIDSTQPHRQSGSGSGSGEHTKTIVRVDEPIRIAKDVEPYFVAKDSTTTYLKGDVKHHIVELVPRFAWDATEEAWIIPNADLDDVYSILGFAYAPIVTRIEVGPTTPYRELDTDFYLETGLFTLRRQVWPSVFHYIAIRRYLITPDDARRIRGASSVAEVRRIVREKPLNKRFKLDHFYDATRAKIQQNVFIKTKLKYSPSGLPIVCINTVDVEGYLGNALGRFLERLRAEIIAADNVNGSDETISITKAIDSIPKRQHNNLMVTSYNKKYDVIRGDADSVIVEKLRRLGSYRTPNGLHVVKGHANARLRGGKGWLVPKERRSDVDRFIFTTLPDSTKFRKIIEDWIETKVKNIVKTSHIYGVIHNPQDPVVNSEAISFTMKEVYSGGERYVNENYGVPQAEFITLATNLAESRKMRITNDAITMLWGIVGRMLEVMTDNVSNYQQFKESIEQVNVFIAKNPVELVAGLGASESLFLNVFRKIYIALLATRKVSPMKACIGAIAFMFKMRHYREIRGLYDAKTRNVKASDSQHSENIILLRTLRFKNDLHVERLLDHIRFLQLNCKVLFLTSLEYYLGESTECQTKLTHRLKTMA